MEWTFLVLAILALWIDIRCVKTPYHKRSALSRTIGVLFFSGLGLAMDFYLIHEIWYYRMLHLGTLGWSVILFLHVVGQLLTPRSWLSDSSAPSS